MFHQRLAVCPMLRKDPSTAGKARCPIRPRFLPRVLVPMPHRRFTPMVRDVGDGAVPMGSGPHGIVLCRTGMEYGTSSTRHDAVSRTVFGQVFARRKAEMRVFLNRNLPLLENKCRNALFLVKMKLQNCWKLIRISCGYRSYTAVTSS